MRLRNVKDANNILINSGLLVEANPFNNDKKLCIEVSTLGLFHCIILHIIIHYTFKC